MAFLDVAHVWKIYGTKVALEDVSISLEPGEICGLLGMNGAGKSTLMKIIASLAPASKGIIKVGGVDVAFDNVTTNALLGAMIEAPAFHAELTGWQNLSLAARLRPAVTEAMVGAAIGAVGLDDVAGFTVKKYSLGMRQRLHFAQAVMASPRLLLLDEPLTGVDPVAARMLRGQIRKLADAGCAILVASHVLSDIEHLCTRVCILDRGRIVLDKPIGAIPDLEAAFLAVVSEGGQAQ